MVNSIVNTEWVLVHVILPADLVAMRATFPCFFKMRLSGLFCFHERINSRYWKEKNDKSFWLNKQAIIELWMMMAHDFNLWGTGMQHLNFLIKRYFGTVPPGASQRSKLFTLIRTWSVSLYCATKTFNFSFASVFCMKGTTIWGINSGIKNKTSTKRN